MAEATGLLKGFSVNNGWTAVDLGDAAPKGISTKKDDVAAAVKELVGQTVTISYTESESNKTNEKTGKPYVNRWLNSVVPSQPVQAQPAQAPAPAAAQASSSPPAAAGPVSTDVSIVRQVSWKVAGALLQGATVDWRTASKWAHSIEADILRGVEPAFGAPDNSEDDIPF